MDLEEDGAMDEGREGDDLDAADPSRLLAHYFVVCGIEQNRPLYPYDQTEQLHAKSTMRFTSAYTCARFEFMPTRQLILTLVILNFNFFRNRIDELRSAYIAKLAIASVHGIQGRSISEVSREGEKGYQSSSTRLDGTYEFNFV